MCEVAADDRDIGCWAGLSKLCAFEDSYGPFSL